MKSVIEPVTTPPARDELNHRLTNIRGMMVAKGLDYYVVAHTDNVYYLTNFAYLPFERPFFLIIPAEGEPCLMVPLLEVSHAEQRILIERGYHTYYEYTLEF